MNLPNVTAYRQALQHPEACLLGLDGKDVNIARDGRGQPRVHTGNFAALFKVTVDGTPWALRCFHRPVPQVAERLRAYRGFREKAPLALKQVLLTAQFTAKGIQLEGAEHPVVWMPWQDAQPLRTWVAEYRNQRDQLRRLQRELQIAACALEAAHAIHGDLQTGNILVDSKGGIVLVDYDGFTVPSTQHLPPASKGHPSFQHPAFDPARHGPFADRFPALVLTTALEALCWQPDLWEKFGRDGEGLLFEPSDLRQPGTSKLFQQLRQDPNLLPWARRMEMCLALPLERLPLIRDLIQPPPSTTLPGLGMPSERQQLVRLLETSRRVTHAALSAQIPAPAPMQAPRANAAPVQQATPMVPLPQAQAVPSVVLAPPQSSPSSPAARVPAKPMNPGVGMTLLMISILLTFLVRSWWMARPIRTSYAAQPSIQEILPVHQEGKTESTWNRHERLAGMRKELRDYLKRHHRKDAERMLSAFDQEVAKIGPDAPDLEDRLQRIILRTPGQEHR